MMKGEVKTRVLTLSCSVISDGLLSLPHFASLQFSHENKESKLLFAETKTGIIFVSLKIKVFQVIQ